VEILILGMVSLEILKMTRRKSKNLLFFVVNKLENLNYFVDNASG